VASGELYFNRGSVERLDESEENSLSILDPSRDDDVLPPTLDESDENSLSMLDPRREDDVLPPRPPLRPRSMSMSILLVVSKAEG